MGNLFHKINLVWHVNCLKGDRTVGIIRIKIDNNDHAKYFKSAIKSKFEKEDERNTAYIIILKKYRYSEGLRQYR